MERVWVEQMSDNKWYLLGEQMGYISGPGETQRDAEIEFSRLAKIYPGKWVLSSLSEVLNY